jgi:hypothetical protein
MASGDFAEAALAPAMTTTLFSIAFRHGLR